MNIEFVSYTGRYPNLCSGILTLKFGEEIVSFGHDYRNYNYETNKYNDNNYECFWMSGGSCGFTNNYANSYVNSGEWLIDVEELPQKYKPYADQIKRIINENIRHGCCGGCL